MDFSKPFETFDLIALMLELEREGAHKVVHGRIRRTMSAISALTDLIGSQDCCEELLAITENINYIDSQRDCIVVSALINQAVMLYVRATKTSSHHRHTIDITGKLTVLQKEFHHKLCNLRDNAVAHYGPGGDEGSTLWAAEYLFIMAHKNGFRLGAMSQRTLISRPWVKRLLDHVSVVRGLFEEIRRARNEELIAELDRAAADPTFIALVQAHPLDLVEMTGSIAGAQNAVTALANGYGRGTLSKPLR